MRQYIIEIQRAGISATFAVIGVADPGGDGMFRTGFSGSATRFADSASAEWAAAWVRRCAAFPAGAEAVVRESPVDRKETVYRLAAAGGHRADRFLRFDGEGITACRGADATRFAGEDSASTACAVLAHVAVRRMYGSGAVSGVLVAEEDPRKGRRPEGTFEERPDGDVLIRLDPGEQGHPGTTAAVRRRKGGRVSKRTGVRLEADNGSGELWTTVTAGTFADA